ncbi:MAG: hypothetical protein ABSG50_12890, partial [Opitutaceae bacterium]
FQVAADPRELRDRKQILIVLMFLGIDVLRDGIGESLLLLWRPVVRQCEVDAKGKRLIVTGQSREHGLGFLQLRIIEPRCCDSHAGLSLEPLDFEDLPLGFGFGPGRKVFANAFSVQLSRNAEDDIPGGIREL